MQVTVYRSSKKAGLYVYLARADGLADLPDAVKRQLGEAELALEFELTPQRTLPNADANEVRRALESQGFYLQMPKDIEAMLALAAAPATARADADCRRDQGNDA